MPHNKERDRVNKKSRIPENPYGTAADNMKDARNKNGEFQPHNIQKEALGPNTKR